MYRLEDYGEELDDIEGSQYLEIFINMVKATYKTVETDIRVQLKGQSAGAAPAPQSSNPPASNNQSKASANSTQVQNYAPYQQGATAQQSAPQPTVSQPQQVAPSRPAPSNQNQSGSGQQGARQGGIQNGRGQGGSGSSQGVASQSGAIQSGTSQQGSRGGPGVNSQYAGMFAPPVHPN